MTEQKEKGASPDQAAPQTNDSADSTAPAPERSIYNPLTWRPEKPARFRGKGKRRTRADAIARKRGQYGHLDPLLFAWLVVGSAAALLLLEVLP